MKTKTKSSALNNPVKKLREIRDEIDKETQHMTNEELRKHLEVKPSLFPGVGEKG